MRLIRCNRCGTEEETPTPPPTQIFPVLPANPARGWSKVSVVQKASQPETMGDQQVFDLCVDCREILLEQFMVGAAVAPITQPLAQVTFPHQPMTDCQLVWNPGKGAFLCYHDDPELYHALILDNAQNVAEGVPEKPVPTIQDWADKKRQDMDTQLTDRIGQLADDMHTSGWAHSTVQRCSAACSEAHTYVGGCILAGVVQPADQPRRFTPCRYCNCTEHLGLRCSSTGCHCLVSTDGEELTAAYSPQEPAGE